MHLISAPGLNHFLRLPERPPGRLWTPTVSPPAARGAAELGPSALGGPSFLDIVLPSLQ